VEPVLEAGDLLGLLHATVYAEDVTRHKPDPEPYLRAAQLLGITHALVVEDSAAGEAAGRAAGFEVLRVTTPADVASTLARHLQYGSMKA
jgi:sugar-phosphatase